MTDKSDFREWCARLVSALKQDRVHRLLLEEAVVLGIVLDSFPELLAACRRALPVLEVAIAELCHDPETRKFALANHDSLVALREAIAAAEGR